MRPSATTAHKKGRAERRNSAGRHVSEQDRPPSRSRRGNQAVTGNPSRAGARRPGRYLHAFPPGTARQETCKSTSSHRDGTEVAQHFSAGTTEAIVAPAFFQPSHRDGVRYASRFRAVPMGRQYVVSGPSDPTTAWWAFITASLWDARSASLRDARRGNRALRFRHGAAGFHHGVPAGRTGGNRTSRSRHDVASFHHAVPAGRHGGSPALRCWDHGAAIVAPAFFRPSHRDGVRFACQFRAVPSGRQYLGKVAVGSHHDVAGFHHGVPLGRA